MPFTARWSQAERPPTVRIGNTLLPVEESTKFLGLWWDSHLSFKKHISVLKTQCKEALNLIRVVAHLKWGGDRDTLLMLYRAIVRSKFDYGCIVYGSASNTNLRQLDSIDNSGLRLALGAFCTSPVSSLYTGQWSSFGGTSVKAVHALSENSCLHWQSSTSCPAWTTRDLYAPKPNGRGGMTWPSAPPVGLKVEEAMTSDLCRDHPPKVLLLCRSGGACVPLRSQMLCQLEFRLLVGLTMLVRLWRRGQTKCNTPLMLVTSVFGLIL